MFTASRCAEIYSLGLNGYWVEEFGYATRCMVAKLRWSVL